MGNGIHKQPIKLGPRKVKKARDEAIEAKKKKYDLSMMEDPRKVRGNSTVQQKSDTKLTKIKNTRKQIIPKAP